MILTGAGSGMFQIPNNSTIMGNAHKFQRGETTEKQLPSTRYQIPVRDVFNWYLVSEIWQLLLCYLRITSHGLFANAGEKSKTHGINISLTQLS